MNIKKKILLMGPIAPPFNGQSIAFTSLCEYLKMTENITLINNSNSNTIISSLKLFLKIIFTILLRKFDVVYFTCSRTFPGSVRDVVLLYCSKFKNIKTINHLHGSDFKQFFDKLPRWYQKILFNAYLFVDTSIVLIDGMEEQFENFPKMKKVVIQNFYCSDLDRLPLKKQRKENEFINILYLSNIMKSKGILIFLAACKEILKKHNNIIINIAGKIQADEEASLKEINQSFYLLLNELNSEYIDKVNYLGICSGDNKTNLLWESDIFILPTYYISEAFPLSIIEAMRTGNYIISTKFKYIPKIVSNKNGILIEPKSVKAIVTSIDQILNNKENLISTQNFNIKWALNNFVEEISLQKVKNVILQ